MKDPISSKLVRTSTAEGTAAYGLSPETKVVLMQEGDASVRRSTYRLSEGLIANFINISMYSLIQASGTRMKNRKHSSFGNILSRTMQMYYHNFIFLYWENVFIGFHANTHPYCPRISISDCVLPYSSLRVLKSHLVGRVWIVELVLTMLYLGYVQVACICKSKKTYRTMSDELTAFNSGLKFVESIFTIING